MRKILLPPGFDPPAVQSICRLSYCDTINVPMHIYNGMLLSFPSHRNCRRYSSPPATHDTTFPTINIHSLLSTSMQFLLKQQYPPGIPKHARLCLRHNGTEKVGFCYNSALCCTKYLTCFYNLLLLCKLPIAASIFTLVSTRNYPKYSGLTL
jgi:hypothetical protein